MNIPIGEDYITAVLQQLVQIDSTNPDLHPDNAGEGQIASFLASRCADLGLEVDLYEVADGRMNVVGTLKGNADGPSLMLNGHMDTVGVEGMDDPFGGKIVDGRLYGRGAQDMKGSLAAMLGAAKAIIDEDIALKGDLYLAFVVDEETQSIGTADLALQLQSDAAIVTEPTDLQVCRAHRGFIWYEVTTYGRAAHGSRYEEGIDAIMHMGRFLAELDKLEKELRRRPAYPLTGPPSLHASLIEGGREISVYPAQCNLLLERRTNPDETVKAATAELQAIIDHLSAEDPTFKAELRCTFDRDPFEVAEDAAIVQVLDAAAIRHLGESRPHMGATFWTDAALLAGAGMETVLLGPIGAGLHSDEEWVDLQSVFDLAQILAETAVEYCQAQ
ncbi:MAG: ArgE/DapE family deacylase [Candidatus Promineifilaceae bacterium]|jgi:acetylornithine deacetylase